MNVLLIIPCLVIFWLAFDFYIKNKSKSKNDPKGPIALPIIGHLHLLGDKPHLSLTRLSQQYGGIFKIWIGDHYTIIVTCPDLMKKIFIKHSESFLNRPHPKSFGIYSNNFIGLAFVDKDDWKVTRKLVATAFTKTKIKTTSDILDNQIKLLIDEMNSFEKSNEIFYPNRSLRKFATNIILKMVFSKEISANENENEGILSKFIEAIQLAVNKLGSGNPEDVISFFSYFSFYSNIKFKKQVDEIRSFLKDIYDQHVETLNPENPRDLFDQMIICSQGKDVDTIIQVGMDFLMAGSDTVSATLEWIMIYMINYPNEQEIAYNELINLVNEKQSKQITLDDRSKTPYLNAIIKEVLRMKTTAPLSVPRQCSEDITIDDYFIPKGTRVIQNIYGLGNSELYVGPDYKEFRPTRFMGKDGASDIDKLVGSQYFGIGPRSCIGESLGVFELFLASSNILLNFQLSSCDGKLIDDTEIFGITIHPKTPLKICLKSRNEK
ncbi:hypothetical protein CYY_008602 [Polysphondylium violaceum]|uniref:Cytochrome P450 family protein n=1 Tax=Polysphondylium violaceum TaxID=133409 RepID=A0A8J4PUX4_9MYCE|nr:hypothetical protein CYY_008602 [Polysphondylium violaceum]